jgi:hypothetical protein
MVGAIRGAWPVQIAFCRPCDETLGLVRSCGAPLQRTRSIVLAPGSFPKTGCTLSAFGYVRDPWLAGALLRGVLERDALSEINNKGRPPP